MYYKTYAHKRGYYKYTISINPLAISYIGGNEIGIIPFLAPGINFEYKTPFDLPFTLSFNFELNNLFLILPLTLE